MTEQITKFFDGPHDACTIDFRHNHDMRPLKNNMPSADEEVLVEEPPLKTYRVTVEQTFEVEAYHPTKAFEQARRRFPSCEVKSVRELIPQPPLELELNQQVYDPEGYEKQLEELPF